METKNKQKILYLITQSEEGGAQRYVFDLAKSLKDEFEIAVAFGEQGEKGELAKKLTAKNIPAYTLPHLKRAISPFNDWRALFEIKKLIEKIQPDIIHLNSSKISILGSLAYLLVKSKIENRKSKIIYTAHGWVFNEPMPTWKKLFYKYAEEITARWKDKIICVSEFDRLTALNEKIAPEKKLVTIHNGIEPVNFLSREEAQAKLGKLGIRDWSLGTNIVSIGNLYSTKGFKYLIEAIKLLITNHRSLITLTIIGEGEERKKLENLKKINGLGNNVFLAGRIDKASSYLKAFDLYVCSSVKEGLSYTIIEAMQACLPIAATNVGGNPELIQDNINGLLAESKNPENLAKKIEILIKNPNLKKQFGEEARKKMENEFTLEKMVKETINIYFKNE
jgi:glycosyltransferase involved in cell wall biosynthesis